MRLLAERCIDLACPVEQAFLYATNLEHFGEWFPGVLAIRSDDGLAPTVVGKRYQETVAVPGRGRRQVEITVREALPLRFLATEGAFPPLLPRMEMAFEVIADGHCRVTWRMFSRNTGGLARWTLIPLARAVLSARAGKGLRALKQRLENSA
ncbi:MAG: SRPBCC family protein [Stagnimonas sp.]|nr:SRPBCC family protein [Stagnimonas sp.]